MRNQDVVIMKQLIGLTNTLKAMNGSSAKSSLSRNPSRCSLTSRKSSMDSLLSASSDSLHSAISEGESSVSSRGLPSVATTLPEAELTESQYRGILMTNIKLWKYSQADEASISSDFSDQEDDVWKTDQTELFPTPLELLIVIPDY